MLELYHFDRSTAAQKVRILLAEKDLEWKSHVVNPGIKSRDQHKPEYLKLNPRGVVPTLVHDGNVIRESTVIMEYIEDVFPEPPLRPADPVERARMRVWTKLIDEGLHVDSRIVGTCIAMRHVMLKEDPKLIEEHYKAMPEQTRRENDKINNEMGVESPLLPGALWRFKKTFTDIDNALAESPWLAGGSYSLADMSHGVYVSRLATFQIESLWDNLTRLKDWHGRIKARPSYKTAVEDWGDTSTPERIKHGEEAFPKVKELWDAAKV